MTEELTSMQDQIKKMQEDTLINNAKKALTEAQERLNARCEQIKYQVHIPVRFLLKWLLLQVLNM